MLGNSSTVVSLGKSSMAMGGFHGHGGTPIAGWVFVRENPSLVGGWATPLKNMKVNWDDYSQYMGKKKCSEPPTRSING